jgi:hypothetical protein
MTNFPVHTQSADADDLLRADEPTHIHIARPSRRYQSDARHSEPCGSPELGDAADD